MPDWLMFLFSGRLWDYEYSGFIYRVVKRKLSVTECWTNERKIVRVLKTYLVEREPN
jgi:hypothetical protein